MRYDYGAYGDFDGFFTGIEAIMDKLLVLLMVALGVAAVVLVLALICYIFKAVALSTMARKRGIAHSWLAWLPIADQWIIGSLSDQYRYVTRRQVRYQRWILLGLALAGSVIGSIHGQVVGETLGEIFYSLEYASLTPEAVQLGGLFSALTLVASLVSIASLVMGQMALYDIYASAMPGKKVVFLVLGLIFPFLQSFFLFACRKQEQGMPPRRGETAQTEPVPQAFPREVVEEPVQDRKEPWDID